MKAQKILLLLFALWLASAGNAWAGGRVYGGVGIYLGGPGPYWGPAYPRPYFYPRPYYPWPYVYPGPFYEPEPVVVVPAVPQVYIEQNDAAVESAPEAAHYWYYCRSARSYYPYVKECSEGWQKVLPQPER